MEGAEDGIKNGSSLCVELGLGIDSVDDIENGSSHCVELGLCEGLQDG